jgi:hypothetical protein
MHTFFKRQPLEKKMAFVFYFIFENSHSHNRIEISLVNDSTRNSIESCVKERVVSSVNKKKLRLKI